MAESQDDNRKSKIGAILLSVLVVGILVASGLVVASWRNKNGQAENSNEVPVVITTLSEKEEKALKDYISDAKSKVKAKSKGNIPNKPTRSQTVNTTGKGNGSENPDMSNADKALSILFDYGSSNEKGKAFLIKFMKGNRDFELNEENLESAEIAQILNDFIKGIPDEKRQNAKFELYGYTDTAYRNGVSDESEESRIFNEKLSLKRAESIKAILETLNIPEKNISVVKGRGFENLVYENKIENPEKSRRVEVFCNYEKEQTVSDNRSWFGNLFSFLFK